MKLKNRRGSEGPRLQLWGRVPDVQVELPPLPRATPAAFGARPACVWFLDWERDKYEISQVKIRTYLQL